MFPWRFDHCYNINISVYIRTRIIKHVLIPIREGEGRTRFIHQDPSMIEKNLFVKLKTIGARSLWESPAPLLSSRTLSNRARTAIDIILRDCGSFRMGNKNTKTKNDNEQISRKMLWNRRTPVMNVHYTSAISNVLSEGL